MTGWRPTRLADVLTPVSRPEKLDPMTEYRLLGVRLDGAGPFLRETKLGSQTSAGTLSRVEAGDFIYSRLFAWRGAFGIISEDLDGCHVSGEFPTFSANPGKLDPKFLRYWFRRPTTLETVLADCTGSTPLTRNRFKEEFFLALEIPLPPVTEHRRIVARIEQLATQIEEVRRLRHQATEETEAFLGSTRRTFIGDTPAKNWLPLSTYVSEIQNGGSPRCEGRPAENDEWGVLKVGAMSFGVFDPRQNKALPLGYKIDPQDEVRPGDFLMSRANTSELVGACVVVEKTPPRLVLSDKSFRFVFRRDRPVDQKYLNHVLKSPALRVQIEQQATGTSPTMKNISKEKVLALFVPPHNAAEQRRIAGYLDGLAGQVAALARLQSETAAALDTLLPSILDKAFKGEL